MEQKQEFPLILMQEQLADSEREENRSAAARLELKRGKSYRFSVPVQTVPVANRERGTRKEWIASAIVIEKGRYKGWRSRFQWHVFRTECGDECPVFFIRGLRCTLVGD